MAWLYALLSATCSLAYLLGLVVGVVLFFFSWKTAIAVILLACVCAPLAKVFDRMKYQEIYGSEAGQAIAEYEWETGKQDAKRKAAIDRAAWESKQPKQETSDPDGD
jgi:hypothetical protein